LASVNA